MKNYILIFILSFCLISCTKEDNVKLDDAAISAEAQKSEIEKVMDLLYAQNFSTMEEAAAFLGANFEVNTANTPQISSDAVSGSTTDAFVMSEEGNMALSEIGNVEITNDMTLNEYESELLAVLSLSELNPESVEYAILEDGIKATIALIVYDLHLQGYDDEQIQESGYWGYMLSFAECIGRIFESGCNKGIDNIGNGAAIGMFYGIFFGAPGGAAGSGLGAAAGAGLGGVAGFAVGFVVGVFEAIVSDEC